MHRGISIFCAGFFALLLAAGTLNAQTPPAAQPALAPAPKLEPLPEIAPPEGVSDADLEPQVTVTHRNGDTIEETRINGTIVWIKVTPPHGRSYYLIPTAAGSNTYIRSNSFDPSLSVPMWVLFTW